MTVPYRTVLALGLAVSMLGAGYLFAPQPGAAPLTAAPVPNQTSAVNAATPALPSAKPTATLAASRAPVPLAPRTHQTYYVPKAPDDPIQTASATTGAAGAATSSTTDAKNSDSAQAKTAIEFDGYKNVRGLEKGPDGVWRGRAMRGRTEIAVRVDASGSVSAE